MRWSNLTWMERSQDSSSSNGYQVTCPFLQWDVLGFISTFSMVPGLFKRPIPAAKHVTRVIVRYLQCHPSLSFQRNSAALLWQWHKLYCRVIYNSCTVKRRREVHVTDFMCKKYTKPGKEGLQPWLMCADISKDSADCSRRVEQIYSADCCAGTLQTYCTFMHAHTYLILIGWCKKDITPVR